MHFKGCNGLKEQGRLAPLRPNQINFFSKPSKLPFKAIPFVTKAQLHLLPTRYHQKITGTLPLGQNTQCRKCGTAEEGISHVFGNCPFHMPKISERHRLIQEILRTTLRLNRPKNVRGYETRIEKVCPEAKNSPYANLRPDIVIRNSETNGIDLIDIKCPVEMNASTFARTHERNQTDYTPLAHYLLDKGYNVTLSTFTVGALGNWDQNNTRALNKMGVKKGKQLNRIKYLTTTSNLTHSYHLWLEHVKPRETT